MTALIIWLAEPALKLLSQLFTFSWVLLLLSAEVIQVCASMKRHWLKHPNTGILSDVSFRNYKCYKWMSYRILKYYGRIIHFKQLTNVFVKLAQMGKSVAGWL